MGKRINSQPQCPLCGRFCKAEELFVNWGTCKKCYHPYYDYEEAENDMYLAEYNPNDY
jgi:hypothetical protein